MRTPIADGLPAALLDNMIKRALRILLRIASERTFPFEFCYRNANPIPQPNRRANGRDQVPVGILVSLLQDGKAVLAVADYGSAVARGGRRRGRGRWSGRGAVKAAVRMRMGGGGAAKPEWG